MPLVFVNSQFEYDVEAVYERLRYPQFLANKSLAPGEPSGECEVTEDKHITTVSLFREG